MIWQVIQSTGAAWCNKKGGLASHDMAGHEMIGTSVVQPKGWTSQSCYDMPDPILSGGGGFHALHMQCHRHIARLHGVHLH